MLITNIIKHLTNEFIILSLSDKRYIMEEKNKKNVRKAGYYYIVFSGSLKDIPFTTKTKKEVLAYIGEKWATKFDRMFDNEDSWWTSYKGFIIVRLRFAKVKAKGDNKRKTLFKIL